MGKGLGNPAQGRPGAACTIQDLTPPCPPPRDPAVSPVDATPLDPSLVSGLHQRAQAERWALPEETFASALERSVTQRFGADRPPAATVEAYLNGLHLSDLALATACAQGSNAAWDHFVLQFRPVLYRMARALGVPGDARELADSLYAELYGLDERDAGRRSLLRYYHGRAPLAGWLRTVLAQRAVDLARAARRLVSLDERPPGGGDAVDRLKPAIPERVPAGSGDPHRRQYLAALQAALGAAIVALGARDRLRLALYYTRGLKLAPIGKLLGESEATTSRKLDRTRRNLRADVEQRLRREVGLDPSQMTLAFEYAVQDGAFNLHDVLPQPDS